jgi:hypothetical protein
MKKVKIALLALLVLLCTAGFAFAEDFSKDGMLLKPGTFDANVGVGYGWIFGFDAGVGAEYIIGKFDIAKDVPLTYGAAARAACYFSHFGIGGTPLTVALLGTLHLNLGALATTEDLKWLDNIDSYIGLGVDFTPGDASPIWPSAIGGVSYFFSKNMAVNLESGIRGTLVGVLLKF